MRPLIFDAVTRLLQPLLLLFSLFLLVSGHDNPGGGFSAGLVAASAFVLHAMSRGEKSARRALRVHPTALLGTGLLFATGSGLLPLFFGRPFLTTLWFELGGLFGGVKLGTPYLFEAGVALVVMAMTLIVIFGVAEE